MDMVHNVSVGQTYIHNQGDTKIKAKVPQNQTGESISPPSKMDAVVLTQAMAGLGQNLSVGEKVSIKVGGEVVGEVVKEGQSNWDRLSTAVTSVGKAAFIEMNEAIQADPAFVFRETVETVKHSITRGAPEAVTASTMAGLYPGVRAGVLALDVYKAWKTLKDPNSSLPEKIIDVGHVITDIGGLASAAAPLFGIALPGAAALAAIAYTVDIIAFGFHSIGYSKKKAVQLKQRKAAKEAAKEPEKNAQKPKEPAIDNPNNSGEKVNVIKNLKPSIAGAQA